VTRRRDEEGEEERAEAGNLKPEWRVKERAEVAVKG
jgi:hypothetical protein